ncbi:MAG: cellulase family glycosylhydrolase [Paludibacter sp.]|nr:cellulase family glycosylhydrolase [Paludibacter sp.]
MKKILFFSISILSFIIVSCKGNDPEVLKKTLSVTRDSLVYVIEGGTDTFTIRTNSSKWHIRSTAEWAKVSVDSGIDSKKQISVSVAPNTIKETRTAKLIITGLNSDSVFLKIVQITKSLNGTDYPNYSDSIPPNATGMNSTAVEIAAKIKAGINIGNTLEAIGSETAWGNPLITNDLIKTIKLNGFNAIRLPCSWNQYSNQTTAKINDSWLVRVKQVVQYCVDNDMYVILNIHWDGGWLENNCTLAKKSVNNAKQRAFWEQIATTLRDFDEHVLFASANEPNVSDATQMAVLLSYHQTFIDAVRSTGGKNAYRVLVVQGPSTDIATTNKLFTKLPTDKVPNRMMAEIHYYTPWNFTGMTKDETWGNQFYFWGVNYHSTTDTAHNPTWGEESEVDKLFTLMKTQFIYKGIPVVVGEYGASRRDNLTGDALKLHLASRAYYFKYVTKQAKANGLLPFFWDTGGMIDRRNYTILDQQALDGLIQGANGL